jgi:hypothetical protein
MKQFSAANQKEILKGNAPFAALSQQLGTSHNQMRFNLHHQMLIEKGGGVYDIDNILVASPRQHVHGIHK